jgi:hypothetical protein
MAAQDRIVPFAIEEADKLYGRHIHISVANIQTWAVREEALREESGLEKTGRFDAFTEVPSIEAKIDQCEASLKDTSGIDSRSRGQTKQRREDLRRLKRVDILYVSACPWFSGATLLIACFSALCFPTLGRVSHICSRCCLPLSLLGLGRRILPVMFPISLQEPLQVCGYRRCPIHCNLRFSSSSRTRSTTPADDGRRDGRRTTSRDSFESCFGHPIVNFEVVQSLP